ncbi:MAG: hypothetical protein PF637_07575 [Spirochaetes bacterium]|nr:hypothetical protein [Spirochaetota bacterium]
MKIRHLILFITLITVISPLKANERASWWQKRVTDLSQQKSKIESKSFYPIIAEAVEYDLRSSNSFFTDMNEEPGTVKLMMDKSRIKSAFDSSFDSIFASEFLRLSLKLLHDPAAIAQASGIFEESVSQQISHFFPTLTNKEKKLISDKTVQPRLAKSLNYELILSTLLQKQPEIYAEVKAITFSKFRKEVVGKEKSKASLISLLRQETRTSLESEKTVSLLLPQKTFLTETPAWRDIWYAIDLECTRIRTIQINDSTISINQALLFIHSPIALERHLFPLAITEEETKRTRIITQALNRERRTHIAATAPVEETVEKMRTSGLSMITKYKLSWEETDFVNRYIDRTANYIKLHHSLRSNDTDIINRNIQHRFDAVQAYLGFFEELLTKDKSEGTVFLQNCDTYPNHIKYLGHSITLLPEYRDALSAKKVKNALQRRNELKEKAKSALTTAPHLAGLAQKKIRADERKDQLSRNNDSDNNATSELSLLSEIIKNYYRYYKDLNHAKDYLALYIRTYSSIDEKLQKGLITKDVKDSLESGSIIPLVPVSNNKIDDEREAKKFLKNAITYDIVRFVKLNNYYRAKGITVNLPGETAELYAIRKKLNGEFSTKINGWTINEHNYAEIDQRLMQKIKQLYRVKVWEKSSNDSTTFTENKKVVSEELGLSYYIPEGWKPFGTHPIPRGLSIRYENSLDNTRLSVGTIATTSESEAVDLWLQQSGFKVIQLGWANRGETLYIWKIGRDKAGNIAKIYAYRDKDQIVLVTGVSTKKRYPFFHNRIDTVFNSLEHSR